MLLGVLAEGDATAYELVKQLTTRSIAPVFWSVSERTLYREPAKLVAEGLAQAMEVDGRPTVYAITARGREVLAEERALDTQLAYQNELLATLYAVAGEPSARLSRRLRGLRDEFRESIAASGRNLRVFAETDPRLPNRALVTSLLTRLHVDLLLELERWLTDAAATVEAVGDDGRGAFAVAEWRRVADTIEAAVERWQAESPD